MLLHVSWLACCGVLQTDCRGHWELADPRVKSKTDVKVVSSLHVLGLQVLHDRAFEEASGGVVVGHDVGLPIPGQLLQSIAAAAQPGFTVSHPVKALAICMEAITETAHLRHDDKVLPVKPASHNPQP